MNQNELTGLGALVLVSIIAFVLHSAHRQKAENEVRKSLIERFGSAQDLGAFLQSEGGKEFIAGISSGEAGTLSSVMGSVQKGIILLLLGFGCAAGNVFIGQVFIGIGLVLMAAGIGFLVSSAVTYRLSKSWGLLGKR